MPRIITFVSLLLALCLAAVADKPGKGKGRGHGEASHVAASYSFLPRDTDIIVGYYRTSSSGLPPGLAKRGGNLPPGLEKQLQRNGHLPPGLEKRLVVFPPELDQRISPCPAGHQRGILGRVAIVWNPNTRVIVDVVAIR